MTDIVERLREAGVDYTVAWGSGELYDEAADEIERLRAVAQHETDCAEAYKAQAERLLDCRTCRHYHHYYVGECLSVVRCVDGSTYQRAGVVRLWEAT